nr:MAG TPA: hypothetical protein [Caudoviricetes sp.]
MSIDLYREIIILYEGSTPPLALKNYLPTPLLIVKSILFLKPAL